MKNDQYLSDQVADFLACHYGDQGASILVTHVKMARMLQAKLHFLTQENIHYLPCYDLLPFEKKTPSPAILSDRIRFFSDCIHGVTKWRIFSMEDAMMYLPPTTYYQGTSFSWQVNQSYVMNDLIRQLIEAGYHRVDKVREPGTFAQRGHVFDFFPSGYEHAFRIEWDDDRIERLSSFDIDTQMSLHRFQEVTILPAREWSHADYMAQDKTRIETWFPNLPHHPLLTYQKDSQYEEGLHHFFPLLHNKVETLIEYLPPKGPCIWVGDIQKACEAHYKRLEQYHQPKHHLPLKMTHRTVKETLASLTASKHLESSRFACNQKPPPWSESDRYGVLTVQQAWQQEEVKETLKKQGIVSKISQSFEADQSCHTICCAPFHHAFFSEMIQAWVWPYQASIGALEKSEPKSSPVASFKLADLHENDLVIHEDHGLGQYIGLKTLTYGDCHADCLVIRYADEGCLYVPVHAMQCLSKYLLPHGMTTPKLHPLSSKAWKKQKATVKQKLHDTAADLLVLYAKREQHQRLPYQYDESDYNQFSNACPFPLTKDQSKAIQAVRHDLAQTTPMDRLVCGDVGFGKTEVALRAAWCVIQGHKQVVMLVPTTVLAQQHAQTFSSRFSDWPIRVAFISRMTQSKARQAIAKDIREGRIDLIIGTHALLSDVFSFPQLGLLIIDEEQKFGVRHKETLKKWRAHCDILTLTATPLPRTLQSSLNDLRSLSLISTPPQDRLSIHTHVGTLTDDLLKEGILREYHRGGQVYVCCNQIASLSYYAEKIAQWIDPELIGIAHGQLAPQSLAEVMMAFSHQQISILVCSSIIESGLDHPDANTLFVLHAERFGLTQLHQIRGRVGRSHMQAYAYFLVDDPEYLRQPAMQRLEALSRHTDLGSGFRLAIEDMELRGVGELFGEAQSGHMKSIGFALYTQWLNQAMQTLRGETIVAPVEMKCDFTALIPDDYVPDPTIRLRYYHQIAHAEEDDVLATIRDELADRYGALPHACTLLFLLSHCRLMAQSRDVIMCHIKKDGIQLTVPTPYAWLPQTEPLIIETPTCLLLPALGKSPEAQMSQCIDDLSRWVKKTP